MSATDTNDSLPNQTLVLIAGQSRAGTTSLFAALSRHPSVGASKLKELRFFLDPDYPLSAPARFDGQNLASFRAFCHHPTRPILLEASPDYLGCATPLTLPRYHPQAKAILIVREPVSRMLSAYRFFRAEGLLPAKMSFPAYIAAQATAPIAPETPVPFRALDHCRTGVYLPHWKAVYGENLLVLDFDELTDAPEAVMSEVCRFLGIEPTPALALEHRNASRHRRSPVLRYWLEKFRRRFAEKSLARPRIYLGLRGFGRWITSQAQPVAPHPPVAISPELRARIQSLAAEI